MAKKAKKLVESELALLRTFIEERFHELKAELRALLAGHAPAKAEATPAKASTKAAAKVPAGNLDGALKAHKRGKDLARAGKQRDQLLRTLIPLYLAREAGLEVNSGAISAFWKAQGIAFAGPNAAKALRSHVGYAEKTKSGFAITPNGVKYVEEKLGGKKLAA